jgi:hypothetical protein
MNSNYFDDYEYNLIQEELKGIISKNELIPIKLSDIKIGDKLYIDFSPYSQKYIYVLHSKLGTVECIKIYDTNDNNFSTVMIKNHKGEVEDLFHDGVSYLGNSLGYDYNIFLVK